MKQYKVYYDLVWTEPEIIEAESKSDAMEQMMDIILDNIGFYIDCRAEEYEEEYEEEEYEDEE